MHKRIWIVTSLLLTVAMVLAACGGAAPATEAPAAPPEAPPEEVGGFQIPEIQDGKFNVAMVLIGPHDDGGW